MTIYLRENDNCYLRRSWSNINTCEMAKQGHNYLCSYVKLRLSKVLMETSVVDTFSHCMVVMLK